MLHLVIADSELETVPAEIANHRVIKWHARKRGRKPTELILNSSLHHPAMNRLKDRERRGRPDIVHFCLLTALDSPLNIEGLMRVYVHTRNNKIMRVNPSVNLPRMYNRFEGLMEQLFMTGEVPPGKSLLTLEDGSLAGLVLEIGAKRRIVMTEKGEKKTLDELFRDMGREDEVCVVVGGFPHGDFLSDVKSVGTEFVSVYDKPLTAPAVVARVISAIERRLGIL
jgi:rRNA small subunit pseudouridine methyltransferase Nep1